MSDASTAAALLDYLREKTRRPALDYADAPQRMVGGFDAAIFGFRLQTAPSDLSGPLVLRLFHPSGEPERARREAAVQNALAEMGYPAPRVFIAESAPAPLGGAFLVMARMPGRSLAHGFEGLGSGRRIAGILRLLLGLPRLRRLLLGLWDEAQIRLHALPAEGFARALDAAGLAPESFAFGAQLARIEAGIAEAGLAGLEPGLAWLRAQLPAGKRPRVICHGDLQPFNILAENGRLTGVIDWARIVIGDPALDLGAALAILATVPIAVPPPLQPVLRTAMNGMARAHVRACGRAGAADSAALRYYQVFTCMTQLTSLGLNVARGKANAGAYHSPAGVRRLAAHIRRLAGITVDFPLTPAQRAR